MHYAYPQAIAVFWGGCERVSLQATACLFCVPYIWCSHTLKTCGVPVRVSRVGFVCVCVYVCVCVCGFCCECSHAISEQK